METDTLVFIKEMSRSFSQIGSLIPSSAALARAMVRPIREASKPLSILEVGPGTGPFTRQILRLMRPEDKFLVCEINGRFMERLQEGLARNRHYRLNRDRVEFFQGPVQALRSDEYFGKFDVVVSSLPFSNFTPEAVDEIFQTYRDLLAVGGHLTFVEYIGLRTLGALVSHPKNRARVKAVDRVVKEWCVSAARSGAVKKEITLLNVPPAFTVNFSLQRAVND